MDWGLRKEATCRWRKRRSRIHPWLHWARQLPTQAIRIRKTNIQTRRSFGGSFLQTPVSGGTIDTLRMAGLNQAQFSKSGTSTMTTAFERGPREAVPGTDGYMRTLCKAGRLKEALHILNQGGIAADSNTYVCLLQECIKMKGLAEGKQVHAHIIRNGLKPNISLLTTLVNMYAKCGSVVDARLVFDEMPERDVYTWTIMMAGYAKHGCGREVCKMYEQMIQEGVIPNKVTFTCILNACASMAALEKGIEVHADIGKVGIAPDIILDTALVAMYAKCGSIKGARQVFDSMVQRDVVSWSTMIAGYAKHGCGKEALEMYEKMRLEGVTPDKVTFICVLKACASLVALAKGKEVHADISKAGLAPDTILETALADMYAKCGRMKEARQVFDKMGQRNVVSWNVMIAGYAQHGCRREALELFENMPQEGFKPDVFTWSAMIAGYSQHGCGREALEMYEKMIWEGVTPNGVTFIVVLNACASLAALVKGKEIHADIIKAAIAPDSMLGTALADMYAKCGSMTDARQVFDNMAQRNVVSWNTMIAGYSQHGYGMEALQLFEQMQQEGFDPDCITFICLLSACSHVGLVDEGCHYFDAMSQDHGLTPTLEHFGCIVDLLGRAGRLDEAEDFINKMPIKPDAAVLGALLGACRIHGNVEVAERVAKFLLKWDPQDAATYVLLSDIYAAAGRWDDTAKVRKMMDSVSERSQVTAPLRSKTAGKRSS